jgi:hypothetical protein
MMDVAGPHRSGQAHTIRPTRESGVRRNGPFQAPGRPQPANPNYPHPHPLRQPSFPARVYDRSCDRAWSDPHWRAPIHGRRGQTRDPKHETRNKFKARSPNAPNPPRFAWAGPSCTRCRPCFELGSWVVPACFDPGAPVRANDHSPLRYSCFCGVPKRAAQNRSCTLPAIRSWHAPFGVAQGRLPHALRLLCSRVAASSPQGLGMVHSTLSPWCSDSPHDHRVRASCRAAKTWTFFLSRIILWSGVRIWRIEPWPSEKRK